MFKMSTVRIVAPVVAVVGLLLAATASAAVPIVENRGQLPPVVRYHAASGDLRCFFTDDALVTVVDGTVRRRPWTDDGGPVRLDGRDRLPTRFSYFHGADPARWQRGVATWAAVAVVAGRDTPPERWWFGPAGLCRTRPGEPAELIVPAGPGAADRPRDPADGLAWSTFLGQSDSDKGLGIILGRNGCPVVIGRTRSLTFPTTPEGYENEHAGLNDVFVAKLSNDGHELVWGTFLGSGGDDAGMALASDAAGDLVIVGLASGPDWPTTPGAYATAASGQRDAVVAKLAEAGDDLLWSTYLGGGANDVANRVLVDADGCPIFIGETESTDWPTTAGATQTTHAGGWDVFVARLAADGHDLLASTLLGGEGDDFGRDVAGLAGGAVVMVGGATASADFPTTDGTLAPLPVGGVDGFTAAVVPSTATLGWSTFLGGAQDDIVTAVHAEPDGHVLVTGGTRSSDFPTTDGAFASAHAGNDDAFVCRLAINGTDLVWSTLLGGGDADRGLALTRDATGGVTVVGYTLSTDLPITGDAFDATANGSYDVFFHQLSPTGSWLRFGTYLGGAARDESYAMAIEPSGRVALVGVTHSSDFPVTPDCYQPLYAGDADALVAMVEPPVWDPTVSPPATAGPRLRAWPNPFNPRVTIGFVQDTGGQVTAAVYDARGRRVRSLADRHLTAGTHRLTWDGRDGNGRPLPAGTYLGEVRVAGERRVVPLSLVR
ncbi:hypothetical protein GF314_12550 [bacterium]|nr:hypothetical protein [bacterium]